MAEALPQDTSKVLCRYFMHNACREGSRCKFSHDKGERPDMVCKYYLKGCCSFADKCRYDHVKPKSNHNHHGSIPLKTPPVHKLTPPSLRIDCPASGMVSLKKALKGDTAQTPTIPKPPEQWVQAKEFVPGQPYYSPSEADPKSSLGLNGLTYPIGALSSGPVLSKHLPASYAHAASSCTDLIDKEGNEMPQEVKNSKELLCPYSANKDCPYGEECEYTHGEVCELCGMAALFPGNKEQIEKHKKECLEQHERDMEISFAFANSKDKQCGICMDTVMEKQPATERRFGILSDCTHCFCLSCIRKWRGSKQFDSKTIRSCPECRVPSHFITPSAYWVDTKEDKLKLIEGYKSALKEKPCKYFDQGRGECPFNEKCFYQHTYPDGRVASPKPRRRRRRQDANGELSLEERSFLWDFISDRQDRFTDWLLLMEEDLMGLIINLSTDTSDDSDDDSDLWGFGLL